MLHEISKEDKRALTTFNNLQVKEEEGLFNFDSKSLLLISF